VSLAWESVVDGSSGNTPWAHSLLEGSSSSHALLLAGLVVVVKAF
jgi:hypothetical protein